MAIPFATTSVSVLRETAASLLADPYDEPLTTRTVSSSGIRAHIGSPGGSATGAGDSQETVQWRFDSDVADITHLDWLQDELSGDTYRIVWIRQRTGLGMDHMEGGLVQVTGVNDL